MTERPSHRGLPATARALADGRPGTGRSFRLHRPRGGYCGAGWCDQCGVDPATGRALCETPADAAGRLGGPDPLRALGLVAEHQVPWFWERRMLRPRALRGTALAVVSHLGATPDLPPRPAAATPAFRALEVGTLHVGDPTRADEGAFVVDAAAGLTAFGAYDDGRTIGVVGDGELLEIRCERLVLATGAWLRLPAIAGNDLPGVLSLDALRRYADAGLRLDGLRAAVVGPVDRHVRAQDLADRGLRVVDLAAALPDRVEGRGRVERVVRGGRSIACDALVLDLDQPAIELALQAGASGRLSDGDLPVVVVDEAPDWLELRGRAAGGPPAVAAPACHPDAFACPCEDVRVRDLATAVADGFDDVELLKRRTGALTGPCQGKLCRGAVLTALRDLGVAPRPITPRPFALPVPLHDLACGHGAS